jgi:hypothetical protein
MKLRQCGKTWESQENGHFSLNNGANSSWIRNSAISYKKNNNISLICIQIPENVAFYFSSKDQWKYALVYCTIKYKSNILIKKNLVAIYL